MSVEVSNTFLVSVKNRMARVYNYIEFLSDSLKIFSLYFADPVFSDIKSDLESKVPKTDLKKRFILSREYYSYPIHIYSRCPQFEQSQFEPKLHP